MKELPERKIGENKSKIGSSLNTVLNIPQLCQVLWTRKVTVETGAHKRHEVAQRSVKLTWFTGSNCCQTLLHAFYHLRIVLITEAIVHLQNKWLSTLGSLKMM